MAYTAPTSDDLIERYAAFADVATDTITYWLDEAAVECAAWPAPTRARAEIAYAAHKMVDLGVLPSAVPAGLSSFKSADFSATINDGVAARTGFKSTPYGREYLELMEVAFRGPIPAWNPPGV